MQKWTFARNLLLYFYSDIFVCPDWVFCTSKMPLWIWRSEKKPCLETEKRKLLWMSSPFPLTQTGLRLYYPSKLRHTFSPNLSPEWRKIDINMPALFKRTVGGKTAMLSHWTIYRSPHADFLPCPHATRVDTYYWIVVSAVLCCLLVEISSNTLLKSSRSSWSGMCVLTPSDVVNRKFKFSHIFIQLAINCASTEREITNTWITRVSSVHMS